MTASATAHVLCAQSWIRITSKRRISADAAAAVTGLRTVSLGRRNSVTRRLWGICSLSSVAAVRHAWDSIRFVFTCSFPSFYMVQLRQYVSKDAITGVEAGVH